MRAGTPALPEGGMTDAGRRRPRSQGAGGGMAYSTKNLVDTHQSSNASNGGLPGDSIGYNVADPTSRRGDGWIWTVAVMGWKRIVERDQASC